MAGDGMTWCRMCGGGGDVVDGDAVETCPICGGSGEHPIDLAYGSVGGDQPPVYYNGIAEPVEESQPPLTVVPPPAPKQPAPSSLRAKPGRGMVLPPVGPGGVDRESAQLWDVRVPSPFGRWGEETSVRPVGYYDGRLAAGAAGRMVPGPCNPTGAWGAARHLFDALQSSEGDRYDDEDRLQPKAFRLVLTCVRCGVVRELRGHLDPDDASVPGDRQVGQLDPTPLQVGQLLAQEVSRSHVWGDEWHLTWTVYADGRPVGWMRTDRGPRGKRYVSGALGHPSVDATVKGASAAAVLRKLATATSVGAGGAP